MSLTPTHDTETSTPPDIVVSGLDLIIDGGKTLSDDFDLHIPGGRVTCLLGPSGIGKSVLLRCILGLTEAGRNRVQRRAGTITDETGASLAGRIAYMAQQDLLLPWLSVIENVTLGSRLRGRIDRKAEENAIRLLDQVGLGGVTGQRPDTLSGGMRQRVALARTLAEDRPVVLMDEPFSKLDAITRRRLHMLTSGLLAGRTVLLVTHDPLEALTIGHRVVVLGGRPMRAVKTIEPGDDVPRAPGRADLALLHEELLEQLAGEVG